jgi:hypothetical protein
MKYDKHFLTGRVELAIALERLNVLEASLLDLSIFIDIDEVAEVINKSAGELGQMKKRLGLLLLITTDPDDQVH